MMIPMDSMATTIVLFVLIAACGATDVLYGKIFNIVTLPALGTGIVINGFLGLRGIEMSLLGAVIGFVPFYIVFRLGGIGGGDVKLMAGIGALKGFPFVGWALFYSILIGGAMAMIKLIWEGRFWSGLRRTGQVLLSLIVPGLRPLAPDPSLAGRVPFGLAIALGTLWAWLDMKF